MEFMGPLRLWLQAMDTWQSACPPRARPRAKVGRRLPRQAGLPCHTHETSAADNAGLCQSERPAQHEECKSRSEEHTSELQSPCNLVCRLLLEKKKKPNSNISPMRTGQHVVELQALHPKYITPASCERSLELRQTASYGSRVDTLQTFRR